MKNILPGFILFSFLLQANIQAQGFLHTQNKQIVNGNNEEVILRGMGLGGWMLQEGYMMQTSDFANTQHELKNEISQLVGHDDMVAFYDAWLANYITEADVDSMASWGFNSIRLPLHYNLFTLPIEQEPVAGENTWLQKGFDLTDSLLKWCTKNQIYLILDLHAAPGGQGKDAAISDYDPAKPSLWESSRNREKTVALWKKLAEHYADSAWIGGYDLINETNWDLSGNGLLVSLYKEITDSIRKVDNNHIIYIEGNWFANDFTGLTPPWDDNMVYSFHKYWTFNDKGSIQWMLDMRNAHNIPIWLGESGENSNTWFQECIKLLEDNNIGWAWWPFKKIQSIAGPLSVKKLEAYNTLLKYWKGEAPKPTVQFAKEALMELAENLKLENCEYHPDVIDAMFRQINSTNTKAYSTNSIPGVIYASNFDMGVNGSAYHDNVVANYHLSTDTYEAWNSGWAYRNDGVDIQESEDFVNSNGFNISHTEDNEWMEYTVNISKTAVYNINVRTATLNTGGSFYFYEDDAAVCQPVTVQSSGGWQSWQTTTVTNVILNEGVHKLKLYIKKGGFNIGGLEFIEVGQTIDVQAEFVGAVTASDGYTIEISINKPLNVLPSFQLTDFTVYVFGIEVPVTGISIHPENSRILNITISPLIRNGHAILMSYSGNQITATDGSVLQPFTNKSVLNTLPQLHTIPGKIEAEEFVFNNGFGQETTTDAGGGINLGWTNAGDYLDYNVMVSEEGNYEVNYRIAAETNAGQFEMQLVEGENITSLHVVDLPVTGGWQTWTTVSKNVHLAKGQHVIRLLVNKTEFNFNWFEFDIISGIKSGETDEQQYRVFPNPAKDFLNVVSITAAKSTSMFSVINSSGQKITTGKLEDIQTINISDLSNGVYYLNIYERGEILTYRFIVKK